MTLLCSLVVEIAFLNPLCASVQSQAAIVDDNIDPSVARVVVANLKDQLNVGLRARRPEEFRFIANIVQMTQQGRLPIKLVLSTFHYVRTKKKDEKFPFVIFERALRIRAAKIGIRLPKV
ncbi:MAG: hypothetical protein IH991_20575 [Planctomycetes bacterium]|nr:hypothetical protein [Planctomycetota bacterium]